MNGSQAGISTRFGLALLPTEAMEHGMCLILSTPTTTSVHQLVARHMVQLFIPIHKMQLFSLPALCLSIITPLHDRNIQLKTTIWVFAVGQAVLPVGILVEMVSVGAPVRPVYQMLYVPDNYVVDMDVACVNGAHSDGQTHRAKFGIGY